LCNLSNLFSSADFIDDFTIFLFSSFFSFIAVSRPFSAWLIVDEFWDNSIHLLWISSFRSLDKDLLGDTDLYCTFSFSFKSYSLYVPLFSLLEVFKESTYLVLSSMSSKSIVLVLYLSVLDVGDCWIRLRLLFVDDIMVSRTNKRLLLAWFMCLHEVKGKTE